MPSWTLSRAVAALFKLLRRRRAVRRSGFAIMAPRNNLGYDGYSYFTESRYEAENILDDVRAEHPELMIVPAVLETEEQL